MKKLLTYSILALSIGATAQSLQRQVISPLGQTQSSGDVTLSYTVGQPISGVIGEGSKLSQGFQQNTIAYQDVELREGWGMVSSSVRPFEKQIDKIYAEVVSGMVMTKNNNGSVYMPEYAFNGIGEWNHFEGYQYKMDGNHLLTLRGSKIIPELNPVTLNEGWNMISYLRNTPADIVAVMDAVVEDLIILKDEDGSVYMPDFEFNGIGNFEAGKGYQIKTAGSTTFTFASNSAEYRLEQNKHKAIASDTKRFARPVNTGSNHSVMILESSWLEAPQKGDELAAYDSGGNMVGSVVLQDGHNVIAVWGDDELTQEKEGLTKGEIFSLKHYKKESDELILLENITFDRGADNFIKDGMTVITAFEEKEEIMQEMELFQNVPNPVSSHTEIGFFLPEDTKATLMLTNSMGQAVVTITDMQYDRGFHSVNLERAQLAAGMYFYSLETKAKTLTKQLTIIQ